jgi:benzoate-CoA ligase family protein
MERHNAAAWLVDRHVTAGDGGRTAVITDDETLTYDEILRRVFRVGHALADLGVRREERVALVLNDEPAFPAWFLGCLRAGVVPVALSTMLTAKELGGIVADAGAGVVVLSAEYAERLGGLAEAAPGLRAAVVIDDGPAGSPPGLSVSAPVPVPVQRFADYDADAELEPAATSADSPGFWLYSSGTTGTPKGVMHRHGDLRATAQTYARSVLGIGPDDRCYSVAKLFFAFGLGNSLTFPFSVGAATVLNPARPTPAGVAGMLERHRPTLFFSSPGFCASLLDAGVAPDVFKSVRMAATAGEALPAELHRRFTERYGFPVLDGIGSTEATHIFLSNHQGRERPGTSGTPVDGYELKLVDESGAEISEADTPGFLLVKGESIATGYWCRTAATRTAFWGEWLRTGDVYARSADGYWTFLGRNNDMMKVGGIWVSPAEVENVILTHPDVSEAAVVGSRTAEGLETAIAFVVPRTGHDLDPASLEAHCRAHMAAFKRPRQVVIVDELPKTATGKVQRFALRERLLSEPVG